MPVENKFLEGEKKTYKNNACSTLSYLWKVLKNIYKKKQYVP